LFSLINIIRARVEHMNKTANFALRTCPEFKDAAKAISDIGSVLFGTHPGPNGETCCSGIAIDSINSVFNALIAKGLPQLLGIIEAKLAQTQAVHDVLQDIVRFLIDNPPAQRALATNFPEGSAARRLLDDVAAWHREEFDERGHVVPGTEAAPSDIGELAMGVLGVLPGEQEKEDGLGRAEAAALFAWTQRAVWKLSAAKGAIQRALTT
jgi:hypothetical protein